MCQGESGASPSKVKLTFPAGRGSPSNQTAFSPAPCKKPSLKLKATSRLPARPEAKAQRQAVSRAR